MTLSIEVSGEVDGGAKFPFAAVCKVNGRPFAGTIEISWFDTKRVPEYDAVARMIHDITNDSTTCEDLAVTIRSALRGDFEDGLVVRVDVTNEAHVRAWAVAR